jgi:hypothetical protein
MRDVIKAISVTSCPSEQLLSEEEKKARVGKNVEKLLVKM